MAINRTIQFKRNQTTSLTAAAARDGIMSISSSLANGEFVINTYIDNNARNGLANIIGVKAQDKMFFIDNQVILNKLGINDDGTVNENISDSIEKLIDRIIAGCGLNGDGTYSADLNDKFISGATSLKNADTLLSTEIKAVEDFIGMGGDSSGQSIVEKIDELSGKTETLSGKTITDVEDTDTIDFTKEDAADGTKKIKADVKISAVSGNTILAKSDGIYTNVDYNAVTNALIVNGVEKPLNAGSIVDSITYDSETEELIITYHTTTSSTPQTVKVNLKDLIEEYDFDDTTDADHNTKFTVSRNVSGATTVQADVALIDCGEY